MLAIVLGNRGVVPNEIAGHSQAVGFRRADLSATEIGGRRLCQDCLENIAVVRLKKLAVRGVICLASPLW